MRIAIYSPYLDTFGGGEKYMMTIAEVLSLNGLEVDVFLDNHLLDIGINYLRDELSQRFNLDLTKAHFIKAPLGQGSVFFPRLFFLKKYDVLFYLTDGSIFFPTAKRNILHIQSPLVGQPAQSWWGRMKLKSWNLIIYNSLFTKNNSQKNWPLNSRVIYPPVDTNLIRPLNKRKYILSVGRFFGYLKDKKHEVMIKAFIDLYNSRKIDDWSLNLAGAVSRGDEKYLKDLKNLSKNFPINFYPNLNFENLMKLYGQSSIYWHASGYEESDPTKMEHFGISTVEAMAAGCMPVVINKGGQQEIVEDKISGYLWDSLSELKDLTLKVVLNNHLREEISKQAIKRSTNFSKEIFIAKVKELIE